jgi:hypothetical protein
MSRYISIVFSPSLTSGEGIRSPFSLGFTTRNNITSRTYMNNIISRKNYTVYYMDKHKNYIFT